MKNYRRLAVQPSYHILSIFFILITCLLSAGCAIFGGGKPKPVPMGEVEFHIQEGDRFLSEGNYSEAEKSYTAAIELHPGSILPCSNRDRWRAMDNEILGVQTLNIPCLT